MLVAVGHPSLSLESCYRSAVELRFGFLSHSHCCTFLVLFCSILGHLWLFGLLYIAIKRGWAGFVVVVF